MNRVFRLSFGALIVLVLASGTGWAQATAQINGTVVDSSTGVLPGVTVIAIQTDTGFRREVVTDEAGSYSLLNLPTGPYRLEATLAGFRTFLQTGIVLQVNSNPVIPITLQLGSLEETVSVEASAPLVETRNPAIGAVIDNEAVEALPLEGRNPTALIALAGAAVDTGAPGSRSMTTSRRISIQGGQAWGVAYLLDGAMHNNWYDGVNLPLPFPDALQEFRVETSSQNAVNGMKGGGTVSSVTKSGTNLFHGDLFEFARHHRFNATSPIAGINQATGERLDDGLVRNQFGGTFGGPIARDRLFFFGAYQGSRATQTPADIITFVPTAAMMAGDFSAVASAQCRAQGNLTLPAALGFVNNRIDPRMFSPAAVKIAQKLPTTTDPCGRTTYSRQTKPEEGQSIAKIDWQISQNHSLFGRYMLTTTFWDPAYANTGNVLATTLGGRDSDTQSLVIGDTMVLTNNIVNNFRVAAHRTNVHRTHTEFFGPEDVGVNIHTTIPHYILISVTGGFTLGTGTETDSWYRPNTYAFSDDLTIVRGNHQWAVGASVALNDWKTRSNVRSGGPFSFNGGVTGLGMADFMLGRVFEYRQATPFLQDITQKYFGVYAQDTWKASPNVTLNYGLRWEPWFPQQAQNLAVYTFSADKFRAGKRSTAFPQAPPGLSYPGDEGFPGKAGLEQEWMTFTPRVGVSWDPFGRGRTSVRGGYGMNSDFVNGEFMFDAMQAPPFGLEQRLIGNVLLDDPWRSVGRVDPYPVTPGQVYDFPPYALFLSLPNELKTQRVHSWNAGVQHQLGDSMAVGVTYLGNRMVNLWGDVTGNPGLLPAGLASPTSPCTLKTPGAPGGVQTYPNCSTAPLDVRRELTQADPAIGQYFGYLDWITDHGWQQYHGMLVSVQRRLSNGLTTSANYTLADCKGLVSQGGGPLNVGTGYLLPVSLINPPSEAEVNKALDADEARCSNAPRHILNLTASVQTPQFANAAARMIVSGWRVSGIVRLASGDYLTVQTGLDRSLTGMQNQRPNQVLDNVYGDATLNNWLNPAAFAQPDLGTHGNVKRNAYEGPGSRVIDLSLVRGFEFRGSHRIEARVEAFNALNWYRWGNPNTTLNNANFGRILNAGDPRVMQFALKYSF
jgi:hypothetical protein